MSNSDATAVLHMHDGMVAGTPSLPSCAPPQHLHVGLLTLKVVSESRVTRASCVPILVFLGLCVLDLGPIYATDRQTSSDAHHRLMSPPYGGGHRLRIRILRIGKFPKIHDFFTNFKIVNFKIRKIQIITFIAAKFQTQHLTFGLKVLWCQRCKIR